MRFRLPLIRSTQDDVESVEAWDADIRRRRWIIGGCVTLLVLASVAWVLLTAWRSPGTGPQTPIAGAPSAPVAQSLAGLNPALLVSDALAASGPEALKLNAAIPISTLPNPALPAFAAITDPRDLSTAEDCLTAAVYYEAGYELLDGQRAVAQVVLNRVRHPFYPKSVCGVVLQGFQRPTGCQFSFTCDGAWAAPADPKRFADARVVARAALDGYVHRAVGSATHYHAAYVLPYWAPRLVKVYVSGLHIFYRFPGYIGTAAAMKGRYAGQEVIPEARVLMRTSLEDPVVEDAPVIEVASLVVAPLPTPSPTGAVQAPLVTPIEAPAPAASAGHDAVARPVEPERRTPVSFRDDRPLVRPPAGIPKRGW